MQVRRIASISIVSIASLIVIAAAAIAILVFAQSYRSGQQNFAPPEGKQAVSPTGDLVLFSKSSGNSSFLYREQRANGTKVRLTGALTGIESEPSFAHDGKLVVYSFASSPDSKSEVWMVDVDGRNAHPITGKDDDALHPVFAPDDKEVFFAQSNFTGNHSPVVRPARHNWDVFSIPISQGTERSVVSAHPTQITHASYYDLQSLDIIADEPGRTRVLISTSAYPIGDLLEEFTLGASGRNKIFQPHVPGEPSIGASYGQAYFIHEGMDIVFLAATDTSGGDFDYNVYSMSDVTGGDIKQLTYLTGMTTDLKVYPDGSVVFVNGGTIHVLDMNTHTLRSF